MKNNLKKVISTVAAFAVVASTATAFAGFPDVDESASYAGAVDTLTALGIVEGDDNGKFNPDNSVTRAEFAKMVVEARGEGAAAESQTVSQFTDVQGHWAVGYIAQGVSDGFINGYDDTTFGPDDTVTYAQAVKMLVCAIGYDAYAVRAGGWPTGYLSYGNSLEITNGVSGVTNDTALTRSQCAVLINNALRAPLVVFDGIEYGGLTGTVPMDKTTVMNGTGKNWQTLLTNNHDAYAVKGRVTATSKTEPGLETDQVKFSVEVAENFDGEEVVKTSPVSVEAYIGTTNAADMLVTYSEAIIQKDTDTDEWTLISLTPYGSNKTAEFAAADVSSEDSDVENNKLAVYKSATSTSVTNYKLDDEVKLYVNGVEYTNGLTEESLNEYLVNNKVGTVTLIDATETGSTSTDGYYEYIFVDYYRDAVADYVSEGSNGINTVYFNDYQDPIKSKLSWDTEDEDISVTFIKDGAEIAVTDIEQYDVLSIAYDVTGDFDNSSFYEVLVSQNTVSGQATSSYEEDGDQIVVIDGNEYIGTIANLSSVTLGTEYTLYLNAFGYVARYDEGETSKNYGVVVGMYDSADGETTMVKIITADGTEKAYEIKDGEEDNFFAVFKAGASESVTATSWDGTTVNKSDIANIEKNVCTFKTTSSGVKLDKYLGDQAYGGENVEYKASANKIGSYAMSETSTAILDLGSYISTGDVMTMTSSSFIEDIGYEAYVYDKSDIDGTYRFVIVTSGTSDVNVNTAVAVVEKAPMYTTVNDESYQKVLVSREGQTNVEVLFEEGVADSLKEGDVIVYVAGSDGVVTEYNKIMSISSTYETLRDTVVANDDFSANLGTVDAWTGDTSKKVETVFGPVYKKTNNNFEILVGADSGVSNVNEDIVDVTIDDNTNIVVYDYSMKANSGLRVYSATALPTVSNSIYKPAVEGENEEYINWTTAAEENVTPAFAYAKVVDGDVTDLVYIVAE